MIEPGNTSEGKDLQPKVPPVWVISLERSKKRRQTITRHLSGAGLEFQFKNAVDGKELSSQDIEKVYDSQGALSRFGRILHPEEIGCTLSHLRCYQDMIEQNQDEVLILEDDAVLAPNFLEVVSSSHLFPENWELVLLFHHGATRYFWWSSAITRKNRLVRFVSPAMGTVAYLIRRGAAKKILDLAYPVQMPADHMTGGDLGTGVNLFGVEPPVVRHVLHRVRDAEALSREESTIPSTSELWTQLDKPASKITTFLKLNKTRLINFYIRFRPKYIK